MESLAVMDKDEHYLVLPNGMKVHKDIVDKVDKTPKEKKETGNTFVHNKADVNQTTKNSKLQQKNYLSILDQAKKEIISIAIANNPGSKKQSRSPQKKTAVSRKKAVKFKQTPGKKSDTKDTLVHRSISLGSYILIDTRDVYRVMAVDRKGFHIHSYDGHKRYIQYSAMKTLRIDQAPALHIGKLKIEYRQNASLENKLLYGSNQESIDIIIATGFTPDNYIEMKPYLVPDIFNELKWEMWITKIIDALCMQKDKSNMLKANINGGLQTKYIIKPQDFVVKINTFNCSNKGHDLVSIRQLPVNG
jgi:hypothetical protein